MELFEQARIGGVKLNNRILRSATDEALADSEGRPTETQIRLYERLAAGGVGGIITAFISVMEDGRRSHTMCMLDADAKIPAFSTLTERVHAAGCPIVAQLVHCGKVGYAGVRTDVNRIGQYDIDAIASAFIAAAVRAQKAGFDAVQLHAAHGYFLSEMLSPHTNRRSDAYGGDTDKRFYLVQQILEGIRRELPHFPIWVKMNGSEESEDGVGIPEAAAYAVRMEAAGVDALEVSHNLGSESNGSLQSPRGAQYLYNLEAAKAIKAAVHIPVILVGGVHNLAHIKAAVCNAGLDCVSMARPLIIEPDLVRRYREHTAETSKCINCNFCVAGIAMGRTLRCYYGRAPE